MSEEKIWTCKIGAVTPENLPLGSDLPMRRAVSDEFFRLTGKEPEYIFSGWGGELTPDERAVVTGDYSHIINGETKPSTTREMIREFNEAFDLPTRTAYQELTPHERMLRGAMLLEEVLEYLHEGLGLSLKLDTVEPSTDGIWTDDFDDESPINPGFAYVSDVDELVRVGVQLDRPNVNPVQALDGLADINVLIHGDAWLHGFDLDAGTAEVHRSNMSKLGADGKPIINGITEGYRVLPQGQLINGDMFESGYRSHLPVGKILKGPNYSSPNLFDIIFFESK